MTDLAAGLTPEQRELLRRRLARAQAQRPAPPREAIPPRPRDGRDPPLSVAQEDLWVLDRLDPGNPVFNILYPVRLRGPLDVPALSRALDEVVRRHESLRTTFPEAGGVPVQRIHPPGGAHLRIEDLTGGDPAWRDAELRARASAEVARRLDLAEGPLFVATLLRLGADDHALLLLVHHIVADGWSLDVLFRELAALYDAFRHGQPSPLPEPPLQFADWAVWQRERYEGPGGEPLVDWWRQALSGAPPVLRLPVDRPRPATQVHHGAGHAFRLPAAVGERLRAVGREEGATVFMTLLAVLDVLLFRWTGAEDFVVATAVANRTRVEAEALIGYMINTLPIRGRLDGDPPFRELLRRVRGSVSDSFAHQELPFETLVKRLRPDIRPGCHPVYQVMLVLQNATGELHLPGLRVEVLPADRFWAEVDFTLNVAERPDGSVWCGFEYSSEIFEPATIARLAAHFRRLAEAAVAAPDTPISALPLLTPEEERRLRVEWNATDAPYPRGACAHQLFEAHARATPDAIALRFLGSTVTYAEFDRRADAFARRLRARGVGPESRVAVCLERSPELILALIAVWKAGGAFVPLDPSDPPLRLRQILDDCGARLVLTDPALADALSGAAAEPLFLEMDDSAIERGGAGDGEMGVRGMNDGEINSREINSREINSGGINSGGINSGRIEIGGANPGHGSLDEAADPRNVACVIYTSGPTGARGVAVQHDGLVNAAVALQRLLDVRPGDRWLQFSPPSREALVPELVSALCSGATLVLAPGDARLPGPDLIRLLADEAVTHALLPPSALAAMPAADLPSLRVLCTVGEPCPGGVADVWAPDRTLLALHGFAETTAFATTAHLHAGSETPLIGTPIANLRAWVVEAGMRLLPVGVPGELCVGGVGVARGYLGRPALTAERFVPDPFSGIPGARLYRTRDITRWRPEGVLECLGRSDAQVQIRGFRIDPLEVELVLRAHPAVAEAAVVPREVGGERRLVAYVVPAALPPAERDEPGPYGYAPVSLRPAEDAALVASLGAHLAERLPEYMLPAAILPVAGLPRTASGKLDRLVLPDPFPG